PTGFSSGNMAAKEMPKAVANCFIALSAGTFRGCLHHGDRNRAGGARQGGKLEVLGESSTLRRARSPRRSLRLFRGDFPLEAPRAPVGCQDSLVGEPDGRQLPRTTSSLREVDADRG